MRATAPRVGLEALLFSPHFATGEMVQIKVARPALLGYFRGGAPICRV